jgi:hypothetical protein
LTEQEQKLLQYTVLKYFHDELQIYHAQQKDERQRDRVDDDLEMEVYDG